MFKQNTQESLGEHIRRLRAEKSWSQEQLSEAAGLSLRTIQRIENNSSFSPESLQAVAGAFNIEIETLSQLAPEKPPGSSKKFGLSRHQASLLGAIALIPTASFIILNVGYYEFGLQLLAPLLPSGSTGEIWSSPFLLLGGPLMAVVLNAPHLFAIRARSISQGELIEGVIIKWSWWRFLVVMLALSMTGFLLAYVMLENLTHLIEDASVSQK